MKNLLGASVLAVLIGSTGAIAQTSPSTDPAQSNAPAADKMNPAAGGAMDGKKSSISLTDEQAQAWKNKSVYSSDGKNVGGVTAIQRDSTGRVTELEVGIGGFLGIGETPMKFTPAQFELQADRVALSLTAAQVKALPKSVQ